MQEQDWASVDLPHWRPRIWIIMIVDVRGSHANHNRCRLNPVTMEDVSKMSATGLHQGFRTVLTSFHECRSKTGPVLICHTGVLGSGSSCDMTSLLALDGTENPVSGEQDWASVDLPHWRPLIWMIMVVCGSCGCFLLEGHCSAAGSVVYNMAALHVCNFHIVGLME
ncbi:unnamed protein product [Arctogadus glacialis]